MYNEIPKHVDTLVRLVPETHRRRGSVAGVGATVGATLGSLVGGPVGAAVGAGLGGALAVVLQEASGAK